jgi:hypothetical protein
LPLAPWETLEEMSQREHSLFISYHKLHYGHVRVDTRPPRAAVTLEIREPDWLGRPSKMLWSRRLDLQDLLPGASTFGFE